MVCSTTIIHRKKIIRKRAACRKSWACLIISETIVQHSTTTICHDYCCYGCCYYCCHYCYCPIRARFYCCCCCLSACLNCCYRCYSFSKRKSYFHRLLPMLFSKLHSVVVVFVL